jgi:hypothetical protein
MRLQQSHPDLLIRARLANMFGVLLPRFGQTAPADEGDLDPAKMACAGAREGDKSVGLANVSLTKSELGMSRTSADFRQEINANGAIRFPRCAAGRSQPRPFASLWAAFCGRGDREVTLRANREQILSRS